MAGGSAPAPSMSPLFPRDLTSKGTLKMSDFFRMHAVATEGPISLPAGDFDNANLMTRALERLGLVPAGPLSALVASGHQLGRSGIKIDRLVRGQSCAGADGLFNHAKNRFQ